MTPEAVKPFAFCIAHLAEWHAAVEARADAMGLEKSSVGRKPLNHPLYIAGLDESGLTYGFGRGQAETQLTLQAESVYGVEQKIEREINLIEVEARLRPWSHEGQETVQSLGCLRQRRGLNRVMEIAHEIEPLDGRPGEIEPELLQAGRAQEAIGGNRYVETALKQVEDEVDALRVHGRLASQEGYLPAAGRPEKIRNVDEILPRQRLAARGSGQLVPGDTGEVGAVAV